MAWDGMWGMGGCRCGMGGREEGDFVFGGVRREEGCHILPLVMTH